MENMEYDIIKELENFINLQRNKLIVVNEEAKELQYACEEVSRIGNELRVLANDFKGKANQEKVSVVDYINFKDEIIKGVKEMKDDINYIIILFNSLIDKNVLDLSKINVNDTFKMFYKTLNDLDVVEKSFDAIPE